MSKLKEYVPVTGLIDTGSDIAIIREDLHYHVVSTADLKSTIIRPARQRARDSYDQKSIKILVL